MLSITNTTSSGASQTIAQGGTFVAGNATGRYLWCPTAMDLTNATGAQNTIVLDSQRTSTTCFMRGLSEHIRMQTSSGLPWFHRRICFTTRSDTFVNVASTDTPITSPSPYRETTDGYQRLLLNATINSQTSTTTTWESEIFKGTSGKDWTDILIAPVDNTRVDLKFDKTWTIKSGNANGTVLERKLWHPMNKNLVYDDDESGNVKADAVFSVSDKRGMGDYMIYDIITPGIGGTAADLLYMAANSTLYWHEK